MSDPYKPRAAFAPWDRRELPGLFTVEESARRVGTYKWLEMRLFESLGGWVATVPELDVKLVLGRHCYHHAWHAELMDKRLPELREMNTERLCEPANDEIVTFVDALRDPLLSYTSLFRGRAARRLRLPRRRADPGVDPGRRARTHRVRSERDREQATGRDPEPEARNEPGRAASERAPATAIAWIGERRRRSGDVTRVTRS